MTTRDPADTDVLGATAAAPSTLPDKSGLDATVSGFAAGGPGPAAAGFDEQLPVVDADNYEILEEYARGGLGRILRARDRRTGREVAIKEVLGNVDEIILRFVREARVTANLQHPAIVPVYELGRWQTGEPFYAMKLVAGRSLQQVMGEVKTLDQRLARLSVIVAVADALAYAHGQRVIHRDLKPANVLVGEFGETVVIDWGLAKVIGSEERPSSMALETAAAVGDRTVAGAVMGTPYYMPPEQASGNVADERADVYAIGALLYQLITGTAPFADRKPKDVGALLAMVERELPTPIAQLEPATPPDLVTIIAKAMAHAAAARYPSARELADDLRRFTNGQLVRAHHYDRRTLLKRWLRRNRAAVTVAAALLGVLVVGAGYSVRQIIGERDAAEARRVEAIAASDEANVQTRRARESLATALYQKGRFAEQQQHWRDAVMYYAAARVQADSPTARWAAGLAEARAIVPHARHTGHTDAINAAAISPDGERVVTVDSAGGVRLWKRTDGTLLAQTKLADPQWAVAFSPDGRELAVGGDAGVIRRLTPRLAPVAELAGHAKRIWSIAYAPAGAMIASGGEDASVRLWPIAGGEPRVMRGHTQRVYSVAFSPDGARLASGGDDRALWVWNVATGTGAQRGAHENGGIRVVEVSRSGDQIMTAGWDFVVRIWPATGAPATWMDKMSLHGAALTPDARVVATAGDTGELRFWETSTHRLITAIDLPGGRTNAVVMSADGRWLVTAGNDRVPKVWNVGALPRLVDAVGHRAAINELAVTADGKRFVTTGDDGTIRIWSIADGREVLRVPVSGYCASPQVALDGTIAAGCDDRSVRRWDATGKELDKHPTQMYLRRGALSPDGKTLALGHMKGFLGLVDMATGKVRGERAIHGHQIYGVAYGANGQLVTASLDNRVKLWTPELAPVREFAVATEDGALAAALSPDGAIVVGGSQDGSFDAWRATTGERLAHVKDHVGALWSIAYAPDGKLVYTIGDDGYVRIWDSATWKVIDKLDGKEGAAAMLAITPDGKTAITGYRSSALIVWDLATRTVRYRIGGNARDHGSCTDFSQQRWVDDAHRAIVQEACTAAPGPYLARIAEAMHQTITGVDVVEAWR